VREPRPPNPGLELPLVDCCQNQGQGCKIVSSRSLEAKDMSSRTPTLLVSALVLHRFCPVCLAALISVIAIVN